MAAGASALVQKLKRFLPLSPTSWRALPSSRRSGVRSRRGTELVHERQAGHHAFILQEGWACAYKLLPDGGRQVIDFSVPGDFMGLRSVLLRTSDHCLRGCDRRRRRRGLGAADDRHLSARCRDWGRRSCGRPRATRRWWSSIWSASAGATRWSARPISCSSWGCACSSWGSARESGFACPLNQHLLADALGLTAIHVNRVLRQLRERGLVTFREGQRRCSTISPACATLAEYHSGYLDQSNGLGL